MVWNQMISCVFSLFFIHYIQSNHNNISLNTNQFVVFSSFFFLLFFNAVQQTFFNDWTRSVCSTDSVVSYCCNLELPTSTLNSVCVTNAYFSWKIGQTCWKLKFVNFFLSVDKMCCRLCHKPYFRLPSKHVWIVTILTKTLKLLRFFFC